MFLARAVLHCLVMTMQAPTDSISAAAALVDLIGRKAWQERIAELKRGCTATYAGRALAQSHALELTVERLRKPGRNAPLTEAERCVLHLANELVGISSALGAAGRERFRGALLEAIQGHHTLIPLFHLARTACLHRPRGFEVSFAGLDDAAPFDLLLWRDGIEVEVVCDVISAEEGRDVHRGAWFHLLDRVDPDLQTWLAAHPGQYLLKMTLPQGLRRKQGEQGSEGPGAAECPKVAALHRRITSLLSSPRRADQDEAAVLRLDPLLLAANQASETGLMPRLRREFGPEAHLAVTSAGQGVFVMAARAAREDEVARAVHSRMTEIAPARLTGTRPGILAMFIEDTDRLEWTLLRDQLRLEGEARQFMTRPEARSVVAITCSSRLEMVQAVAVDDDGVGGPELRFRNPNHPQAKVLALASVVLSCC